MGKRLAYPYSCPYNGQRNDNCNCTNNGHINQGLTRFNKIRVDLHNMKINPNDFTFALTEYGSPVAYGTAGDCYSMSDCPQGRFSIDLRGTNFKIVEDLEWIKQGHRTSLKIERLENNSIINGLCGGYCGGCTPDRFKGLIIGINNKNKLN
ncbi:GON domain-containing protein [Meloidogyne graminicola]|uniref:GON domain-containing protein n=1 Tax=Meloidogyne graminicola TaxID=189291 RepID=A0A8S9ZVD2_9BILA|nr:GON domain-containing protein [Meloidogyne graminicola]